MDAVAGRRRSRRGVRLWLWLLPLWLPVICYLLGSLWLASPWGCSWVAARISAATGLDAGVGRVSVTPWSGISLHELRLLQPPPLRESVRQPVLAVVRVRVFPDWRSWLAGKREIRSIEVDSPRGVVAREMLAALAGAVPAPAAPAAPPPLAATGPPAAPAPQEKTPPPALTEAPAPPPLAATVLPPTAWIRLHNASLVLLSADTGKRWLEVEDLEADVPVAGRAATSRISVSAVKVLGKPVISSFSAPLEWRAPVLAMMPAETTVNGVHVKLAGMIVPGGGWPVRMELAIPRQKPAPLRLADGGFADAGTLAANGRFAGLLRSPTTWQADWVVESAAPSVRIGGHQASFDRGRAVVVLRGGLLSCLDARLIGDDLAVLGNGTLLANGRLAAAVRLVAPPDVASAVAAKAFPGLPGAPSLTSLSTPQRSAFDVEVSGDIRRAFVRAGAEGPVFELQSFPSP